MRKAILIGILLSCMSLSTFAQAASWYNDPLVIKLITPHYVALATCQANGGVLLRHVKLKSITHMGFRFMANPGSEKIKEARQTGHLTLFGIWKNSDNSNTLIEVEGKLTTISGWTAQKKITDKLTVHGQGYALVPTLVTVSHMTGGTGHNATQTTVFTLRDTTWTSSKPEPDYIDW